MPALSSLKANLKALRPATPLARPATIPHQHQNPRTSTTSGSKKLTMSVSSTTTSASTQKHTDDSSVVPFPMPHKIDPTTSRLVHFTHRVAANQQPAVNDSVRRTMGQEFRVVSVSFLGRKTMHVAFGIPWEDGPPVREAKELTFPIGGGPGPVVIDHDLPIERALGEAKREGVLRQDEQWTIGAIVYNEAEE